MENQCSQGTIEGRMPHQRHEEFNMQERYLDALIRVSATHKVHGEIDEAIKKLKELTYS